MPSQANPTIRQSEAVDISFYGDIIKIPIIHTKAEASIWLPIEKNKYSGRRFGRPNKAVGQVGFDVGLQGL